MLHEGPDRLAQWASQGWLATADTHKEPHKDPRTWFRYEPRINQDNFLSVWWKITQRPIKLFSEQLNFLSLRHFVQDTDVCPVVGSITWMKHLQSSDLEIQFFLQTVLSLYRHTTKGCLLHSTKQTRSFGLLLYSLRLCVFFTKHNLDRP